MAVWAICGRGFHNGKWDGGGNGLVRWTNLINFYPTLDMMRIPLLVLSLALTVLNNDDIILAHCGDGNMDTGSCSKERD